MSLHIIYYAQRYNNLLKSPNKTAKKLPVPVHFLSVVGDGTRVLLNESEGSLKKLVNRLFIIIFAA